MESKLRRVLQAAAADPDVMDQLRTDPETLATRFDLDDKELDALLSATQLIVSERTILDLRGNTSTYTFGPTTITGNPPSTTTYTFGPTTITGGRGEVITPPDFGELTTQTTSPITITAGLGINFDELINPAGQIDLSRLSKERLIAVLHRVLDDANFADDVRHHLRRRPGAR